MVACGRSSIIQWPVSSTTIVFPSDPTSFACSPRATPFAFSPPIDWPNGPESSRREDGRPTISGGGAARRAHRAADAARPRPHSGVVVWRASSHLVSSRARWWPPGPRTGKRLGTLAIGA